MKVFSEDDDGENKALMQDNPKHGEGTGQTECCGESPTFNKVNMKPWMSIDERAMPGKPDYSTKV